MDHLPFPKGSESRHIEVPHLRRAPPYDGKGFVGYLERAGIRGEEELLPLLTGSASPSREEGKDIDLDYGQSCFQEWMFFGLLDEFLKAYALDRNSSSSSSSSSSSGTRVEETECQANVVLKDFVRENASGQSVLTTSKLPGFVSAAVVRKARSFMSEDEIAKAESGAYPLRSYMGFTRLRGRRENRESGDEAAAHRWRGCLETAFRFLELVYEKTFSSPEGSVRPVVLLACAILWESLSEASLYLFFLSDDRSEGIWPWAENVFFAKFWRERNLCPYWTSGILYQNVTCVYFAACLLQSETSGDHSACKMENCLVSAFSLDQMAVKHDGQCSGKCAFYLAPEEELSDVLESGSYPVIVKADPAGGASTYSVRDGSSVPYVALSHVWSQGLGNPQKSGLPSCQVKMLFSLIDQIDFPGSHRALWIDTLCIPPSGPLKKVAISRMRRTYSNANKVLVLDQKLRLVGESIYLKRLELSRSEWVSRLWTFQECWLAHDLWIQYQNDTTPFRELVYDDTYKLLDSLFGAKSFGVDGGNLLQTLLLTDPQPWHSLDTSTYAIVGSVVPKRLASAAHPLGKVVQSFQKRQTTVAKDEPVCLATIMDVDIASFRQMPTMKDVLTEISKLPDGLPTQLLFDPGKRLTEPGFRWAPASFLRKPYSFVSGRWKSAELCSNGLILEAPGIRLLSDLTYEQNVSREKSRDHGHCELRGRNGQIALWFHPAFNRAPSPDQLTARAIRSPAIIYKEHNAGSGLETSGEGVLVSDVWEDGNVFRCHYEVAVRVRKDVGNIQSLIDGHPRRFSDSEEISTRKWCVD